MRIVDSIISELEREAETTKRVLERVPNDKLNWRPHAKSMSLGQLAQHVATVPGGVASIIVNTEREAPEFAKQPSAEDASQLIPTLMKSVADAKSILNHFDDNAMMANWRLTRKGQDIFSLPRLGVARTLM